jgi:hypothetical protein
MDLIFAARHRAHRAEPLQFRFPHPVLIATPTVASVRDVGALLLAVEQSAKDAG